MCKQSNDITPSSLRRHNGRARPDDQRPSGVRTPPQVSRT